MTNTIEKIEAELAELEAARSAAAAKLAAKKRDLRRAKKHEFERAKFAFAERLCAAFEVTNSERLEAFETVLTDADFVALVNAKIRELRDALAVSPGEPEQLHETTSFVQHSAQF